jgi:hypothetical protein
LSLTGDIDCFPDCVAALTAHRASALFEVGDMTQVTAANPGVRHEDIQNFCYKEVNRSAPQK